MSLTLRSCAHLGALLFALVPATAQELGPVKNLPGDLTLGPAAWEQAQAQVEAGAGSSLVVWTDNRTHATFGPFVGEQTGSDVLAVRLDPQGVPLDATPLVISMDHGNQSSPRATWNGSSWLVTWENQTATSFFYEEQLWGVRVAPDGTVLDPTPLVILGSGHSLTQVQVASNGSDWLVVGQGDTGGGILGVRIAGDGTLLDLVPQVVVPPTFFLYFDVQLSASSGSYLLTYDGTQSSLDDWQGQLLDGALAPLGPTFTVPLGATVQGSPAGYLVARLEASNVKARRLSPSGAVLDPVPIDVTAPGVAGLGPLGLTFDGSHYWASFTSGGSVVGARVSTSGQALDPQGVVLAPVPAFGSHVVGGASAGGVDVVAATTSGIYHDLVGYHTSASLAAAAPQDLALSAPSQEAPDVTPIPGGFAVVWTDHRDAGAKVMLRFLDEHGHAQGPAPIEVADGSSGRVAFDGSLLAISYAAGGNQVEVRRALLDGTLLDATPISVMNGTSPDIAASGGRFLVVAADHSVSTSIHFALPVARRLDGATGQVLDPASLILGQYFARYPRVTDSGGRWAVTWQRNYSHDDPGNEVRATFVEQDGTVHPDAYLAFGGTPDVASSGGELLFVWRTGTSSSSAPDLAARVMLADGTLLGSLGGFSLTSAPDVQRRPRVAWAGDAFQVVWEDLRESVAFFDERSDLYGARVSASGTVLEPGGVPLVQAELPVKAPTLAPGPSGSALLVHSAFSDEVGLMSYRLRTALAGAWGDQGLGLPGTGVPVLDATGQPQAGGTVTLALVGAQPSSPGAFVVGLGSSLQPLFGGILVPTPDLLFGLGTDVEGRASLTAPVGVSLAGLVLHAQAWVVDPGGPAGFASSNGVAAAGH